MNEEAVLTVEEQLDLVGICSTDAVGGMTVVDPGTVWINGQVLTALDRLLF